MDRVVGFQRNNTMRLEGDWILDIKKRIADQKTSQLVYKGGYWWISFQDKGSKASQSVNRSRGFWIYFEGYQIKKKVKLIDIGLCRAFIRIFGTFFMDGNLGHWIV
jgi:hypothetical protein